MKKTVSLLILIFATGLFAQEVKPDGIIYPSAETQTEVLSPESGTPAPVAGGALTGLFYVIFLAAVGTIGWYFWKQRTGISAGSCCVKNLKGIEIGSTRSLGSRQFLVVAKYRDKEIILGVGPGFINKIETLEKEEEEKCEKQPSA